MGNEVYKESAGDKNKWPGVEDGQTTWWFYAVSHCYLISPPGCNGSAKLPQV